MFSVKGEKMEKIRNIVLGKVKLINQEIKESLVIGNTINMESLYKQRRKLVSIYRTYKQVVDK